MGRKKKRTTLSSPVVQKVHELTKTLLGNPDARIRELEAALLESQTELEQLRARSENVQSFLREVEAELAARKLVQGMSSSDRPFGLAPHVVLNHIRSFFGTNGDPSSSEVWGDKPLPEDEAIRLAHPTITGEFRLYEEARRLVHARRSKVGLVDLVNWLLSSRKAYRP